MATAGVIGAVGEMTNRRAVRLALSMLCENPGRKTGLTSLYHEFVAWSLKIDDAVEWIVYTGPDQEWAIRDSRIEVVDCFPANDRIARRLFADHFRVAVDAKGRGADALLTTGFVPLRARLPVIMHLLSLQHLSSANRVGGLRSLYRSAVVANGVRRSAAIITNTRFAVSQILAEFPEVEGKLVQSYEGLQRDAFIPARADGEVDRLKAELGVDPGYLFWSSNFYPYKQAELLFDAYARLTPEERARMPVVMVGGGKWGKGLESAKERARSLGIEDDVTFLGWVPDALLAPLYRSARAFVLPSREETFGRCVLEAMACGIPCIVNDIEVMHEVTGGHAVIVDFQDAVAAEAGLRAVAFDEGLRRRLRESGLEKAQEFSFERLARERIAAVRRVLGK